MPALDATFVVAKRIKYRRPVYAADSWHFHHRFANIGFSQRRTVLYLYGWTLSLAALALAMRFVPYSDDDGTLHAGWTLVIVAFGAVALAASVYLVVVLEILKFRRFREREIRRAVETGEMPALSEDEIEQEIEREVETGEFEAVEPPPQGAADGPAGRQDRGSAERGSAERGSAGPKSAGPPEPVAGDGPTVRRQAQNRLP